MKKSQIYSKEIKLKAVEIYIQDGLSAIQMAKELELTDSGRVYKWADLYKEKGGTAFGEERRITKVFLMIFSLCSKFNISNLCEYLEVSKGGYYKWLKTRNIETLKSIQDKYIKT